MLIDPRWLLSLIERLEARTRAFTPAAVVYVGGASARALLHSKMSASAVELRDLDVMVVAGRPICPDDAAALGEHLASSGIGEFLRTELRPRIRFNAASSSPHSYTAGHGFFIRAPNGLIVDLSIFHTAADLDLNGILTIDSILIPVSPGFESVFSTAASERPSLLRTLAVHDDYGGLDDWLERRVRLKPRNSDFHRAPGLNVLRIARTCAMMGYRSLPNEISDLIEPARREQSATDRTLRSGHQFQFVRTVLKICDDPFAFDTLMLLRESEVLDDLAPGLSRSLHSLSERGWRARSESLGLRLPFDLLRRFRPDPVVLYCALADLKSERDLALALLEKLGLVEQEFAETVLSVLSGPVQRHADAHRPLPRAAVASRSPGRTPATSPGPSTSAARMGAGPRRP